MTKRQHRRTDKVSRREWLLDHPELKKDIEFAEHLRIRGGRRVSDAEMKRSEKADPEALEHKHAVLP
jgi:hypothetical protein